MKLFLPTRILQVAILILLKIGTLSSENHSNAILEVNCKDMSFVVSMLNHIKANTLSNVTIDGCNNKIRKSAQYFKNGIITTHYHSILESVVDLMLHWKRFQGTFILDEYMGIQPNEVQRYLNDRSIKATIVSVDQTTNDHLRQSLHQNIIIICLHTFIINQVISQIISLGWFYGNNTMIVVNRNIPTAIYNMKIPFNVQITLLSPTSNPSTADRLQFHFLTKSSKPQLISFIQQCSNNHTICSKELSNIEFAINPFQKMSLRMRQRRKLYYNDIFNSPTAERTESVVFGEWNLNARHRLHIYETFKADDYSRLKGRRARIVFISQNPCVIISKRNNQTYVTGIMMDIVDSLTTAFNMSYVMNEVENVFGIEINGTFNGIAGYLYRKEAEMTLVRLGMTSSRNKALRFSGPALVAYLQPIYIRPEPCIPLTTYLMPFSTPVWLIFIFLIIFAMVEMFILLTFFPFGNDVSFDAHHPDEIVLVHRWSKLTFRIVFGTILLTSLTMSSLYNSNITAFLTYQQENTPFKTSDELITNKKYTIHTIENSVYHETLKNAKSSFYAQIWQRMLEQGKESFSESGDAAISKLLSSRTIALLLDVPSVAYTTRGNCSIAYGPFTFMKEYYHMGHRSDFPFSKLFNTGLIKLLEGGIIQRLETIYGFDVKQRCPKQPSNRPLRFINVALPFIFYFCAISLVLIILIIENIVYRFISNGRKLAKDK